MGGAQVQMAGLQAQQLAWQQENLAARLAGLKAAAARADLTQLLKARPLMLTRTGAEQGSDVMPHVLTSLAFEDTVAVPG